MDCSRMPSSVLNSLPATDPVVSNCPICGDLLIEVEAGINRTWGFELTTAFARSVLEIRMKDGDWMPFMFPDRSAKALYCTKCGSLTVAPSIEEHREKLGLEP